MKKSEILSQYFEVLNVFEDYVDGRRSKKHKKIDFSAFDSIKIKNLNSNEPKKSQVQQTKTPSYERAAPDKTLSETISDRYTKNEDKRRMIELAEKISKCEKCPISNSSATKIFGIGSVPSKIVVISANDYISKNGGYKPMSDRDYEYFKKWIDAVKINIEEIFITSLLKCNIPGNRISKEFITNCSALLKREIEILNPSLILALGEVVLSSLKQSPMFLQRDRGRVFHYYDIPFIATYHPKSVLENQNLRKFVWADIRKFKSLFDDINKTGP
ncbi:MAG TPA: uracil-DNA glycosylase [Spirochaetota bacterium]|nr:uracil-DNA glycosylase [Spirochaetota bacterium]HOS33063.1 uracil-DNA glycosylase [Spirochaetota bacterium]HOS55915.1 uracil-DNA glycosylase [Spirochaetota bacterium]HPK61118.1 uracil-DNA glycosylase [Spirochaetota bacterium]HQF78410.1 uracil-DNA glycosylase [Spirochaetota bacterium]